MAAWLLRLAGSSRPRGPTCPRCGAPLDLSEELPEELPGVDRIITLCPDCAAILRLDLQPETESGDPCELFLIPSSWPWVYVAGSRIVHRPNCRVLHAARPDGIRRVEDEEALHNLQLRPCRVCRPSIALPPPEEDLKMI